MSLISKGARHGRLTRTSCAINIGRRGHTDEGYRFVRLGIRIMERFDAKEWQSRLAMGVYGGFYTMRHPVRDAIKPLLAAHRAGLVVGDIHVGRHHFQL